MRDRLADRDVRARQQRRPSRAVSSSTASRGRSFIVEAHVDLRRFDALHVLVELGAPVRRAVDVTSGTLSSSRSSALPKRIRVGEARARNRHRAHGQRAFVELRQKRSARGEDADERRDEQRRRRREHQPPIGERVRAASARTPPSSRRVSRGSVAGSDQPRVRQQPRAQHRRHRQRHDQRRDQRDDVREAERPQQPPFDAAQA